jgi:hypothetical protein
MSALLVDFHEDAASPRIEADFAGVSIAVEAASAHGVLRALRLRGVYRVPVGLAGEIGATPLQKALIVTVTSGLGFWSFNLLGEQIAFDDDEQVGGGFVRGYFNADLLHRCEIAAYATGYILVSLGPAVSNVTSFTAT